jgi:hypothetical protein
MTTTLLWAIHLAAASDYWQLVPLVIVVSIVYSATRHERWALIWRRAVRLTVFILVFMATTLAVLWGLQTL